MGKGKIELLLADERDLEVDGIVLGADHIDEQVITLYLSSKRKHEGIDARINIAQIQFTRSQLEEFLSRSLEIAGQSAAFVARQRRS